MTKFSDDMIAEGVAGAVGRVITAPLDVIKIRHENTLLSEPYSSYFSIDFNSKILIFKFKTIYTATN